MAAVLLPAVLTLGSCSQDDLYLHYALKAAGDNKAELKDVLRYYRTEDKDPLKLKAAKYLIANMPAHYSYADTAMVNRYYDVALQILKSGKSAEWQRDTLRVISERDFPGMSQNVVSDVQVITSDYLIYSIDHAFTQWRTRPWAKHLTYEEFRDWLLPYKVAELQSFDAWRDTLSAHFCDSIGNLPVGDDRCRTIYGALDIVRTEMVNKLQPCIVWENSAGHPLLSAETMAYMTYGACLDYVTAATAVFRSLGLPVAIDNVPVWGRNNRGHFWFTFLSDNGIEVPTEEDVTSPAGWGFFPYQRFPKIYRTTYAMNRDVIKYRSRAKSVQKIGICKQDVTGHYYRTSDIEIPVWENVKMKDRFAYIIAVVNNNGPTWQVLDFGKIKKGKACFTGIGRELLYLAMGYDGNELVPISDPFIVQKDGSIEYINYDNSITRTIEIRRKFYESYNVVEQRRKLLGAKIQCADRLDFSDAKTLYAIDTTAISDKIQLPEEKPHRYWRYLSPDDSWGSIAELAFYDESQTKLNGIGIANEEAGQDAIERAYDGNLLSNFEINQPDDNWVGMDMESPTNVRYFSVSPRSDDNDICPGNEYELFYFHGAEWCSLGYQKAGSNILYYDNTPINTILWLRNYTRGNDERPFILDVNNQIEWW